MSNLTIVVDEETLKRARIRALEEGTSVNAVLREFLEGCTVGGGPKASGACRELYYE